MNCLIYSWVYGKWGDDMKGNYPMRHFRYWCYKVLPLVYDDSLSYYEVLCKVVDYINQLIDSDKEIIGDIEALRAELQVVSEWVNNFDTSVIEDVVENWLATSIFVEITDSGYFVYYIPESWDDITFNTTGLDMPYDGYDYGHLALSY